MVQAINRDHSQNTISTYTDDCYYIYNDGVWLKASTNYYKYFDSIISKEEIRQKDSSYPPVSVNTFNLNDYIISYKSITNYIKYSESFKPNECKINNVSQWKVSYLNQLSNDENFRFPNTGKVAARFQTTNSETERYPTEHSISQLFYTNPNELYIASCYVKQISTSTNNISFQFFDDTYNIGISAKYNLNDGSGYDESDYKEVNIEYIDSNFNVISQHPAISHFSNVSAGIYRYVVESNTYYRLVIKCSCDFSSNIKLKLLLLNNNSEYKYFSKQGQDKYIIYTNAFQIEKHDDLTVTKPSDYLITTDTESSLKIFDKMYKVTNNPLTSRKEITEIYNKMYYVYDITEHSDIIPNIGLATYLISFKPAVNNPINGDIIVVPSMITFTEYKNNRGNVNKDSMIRLGDAFIPDNPSETINYDLINSQYKIKHDNSFKILSYTSEEKNRKSMVKAMTFNQGYFETWCKQDTGDVHKFGYNTGGGFNYHRIKKFYPDY